MSKKNNMMLLNYTILETIGKGAFGDVYKSIHNKTNNLVALKVEKKKIEFGLSNFIEYHDRNSRLIPEYYIYKKMLHNKHSFGIPIIYKLIQTTENNIMVMQLLGESLEDIFNRFEKKFSISTVLHIGYQIIKIIENVHKSGYVHRDIKPNNFLTGNVIKSDIYITDFGLSKSYIDKYKKHIPITYNHDIIGTARYSSINMHRGIEPSRRDDLEAIGHMLIYFIKGKLPWQGITKNTDKKNFFEKIGEIKMLTPLSSLCDKCPKCIEKYITYCRNLNFSEKPNYEFIKELFLNEIKINNYMCEYEWIK